MNIKPYTIAIPDSELADLRERLGRTRWPAALTEDWARGTPVAYAKRLVDYWLGSYDWRTQEARLNRLPQFLAELDGQPIHGLHVRSADDGAVPLLLLHGYPSCFVEFAGIAPALANAEPQGTNDASTPSLPRCPGSAFRRP